MSVSAVSILAVEDDECVRAVLTLLLEHEGLLIRGVATGEEALDQVRNSGIPDLLITDLDLGQGMDGLVLAKRMRLRDAGLPIIFFTGRPWLLEGVALDRNTRLVAKPLIMASLIQAVKQLLIYDRRYKTRH